MTKSRFLAALCITLLALALRWRAALMLPVDYDEPVYLDVAAQFAAAIQAQDWPALLASRHSLEHPALVKLLYAAGHVLLGSNRALTTARAISVSFGVLQVALLALLNPIAGFFLAIHTMAIKYTSQAYLEGLPSFTSLLAIVAWERSTRHKPALNRWLVVSALALGITAAAKYTYLLPGLLIVALLISGHRTRPWLVTLYLGIALLAFVLLDIQVWANPIGRLLESLRFHPAYAQSPYVQGMRLPWYQQLHYLSRPVPWHPGVFLFPCDTVVFALGIVGIPILFRQRRLYALWLLLGIVVLLSWPTRWPQYTLIVVAPLCLSAGLLVTSGLRWLDERTPFIKALRPFAPDQATSLFLAALGLGILVFATYIQFQYGKQMEGWTYYSTRSSNIPSDTVRALAIDGEGHLWAGTEAGAAQFKGGEWVTYNRANSGLVHNSVRAVAVDGAGRLWFGTDAGISLLDGNEWHSYTTANAGLVSAQVLCITPEKAAGSGGEDVSVWVGTEQGASYFDGRQWTAYTPENSGLAGARVLSIAIDAQGRTWFGTWGGLSVFDGQSWTSYTTSNSGLAYDTVSSIAFDDQGRIWCGTLDGVSVFDGTSWRTYSLMNMTLRVNTATALAIDQQGRVWVGGDLPTGPTGSASMFDGQVWHDYSQYFSGTRQAPVRAIAVDPKGRIWFGTVLEGVILYEDFKGQK